LAQAQEMSLVNNIALFEAADGLIRKLIFDRVLRPGQRIDEQALARDFGISRTPLREALKVLHNEGLVRLVPRRGCFVAELSDRDLDEIYEMVALLESTAAARAAELATPAEVAKLRRVTQRMAQMAAEGQHKRYFEANLAAHDLVLEIAGNRWQKDMIQYLRAMCRLSPYVSIGKIPGRLEQSLGEHQELLAAIEARDPQRARDVMRRHVVHTRSALRKLADA
jgi:DNA-binding GntR family transcriptional regulator